MKFYLMHTVRALAALLGVSTIVACGGSDSEGGGTAGTGGGGRLSVAARNDLIAKGVNKYFGKAPPSGETTNAFGDTVYSFDPNTGPVCLKGEIFKIVVHETSSENLLIYLEGGGACWLDLCAAKEKSTEAIPKANLLDQDATKNVVGDWNIVYVSYCDGSVFSGDNDVTRADGTVLKFHGLRNLSAAIDVTKSRFPAPKRILLAGSSAGGYGTLPGTGVVRLQYPDTDLFVFNDAGVGLSNPNNPTMLEHIEADWKFQQFVPDSCTACKGGQQTALIAWGLEHDPSLKVSAFSAYEDSTIGGTFLGMTGPDFKALLLAETGKVHDAFPTRFQRFMIAGEDHTALLTPRYYQSTINGTTLAAFTRAMIEGTGAWTDSLEAGGY